MPFQSVGDIVRESEKYGDREVGLTHPDHSGFIRVRDNGDVEIFADEGLCIIMNPRSKSITFVADSIKFITRKESGLRWNNLAFNDKATSFNQTTFIPFDPQESLGMYRGVHYFLDS